MQDNSEFGPRTFALAQLFVGPVYAGDTQIWETIRGEREYLARYFRQIGQELVVDEAEGYAFIRQMEPDGEERVPRIGRRQVLGYAATVLLVCLREELARFDAAPGDSTRLVLTRQQLRDMVAQFIKRIKQPDSRYARDGQCDPASRRTGISEDGWTGGVRHA
ncbi:MAG: DUF4194 domain-containing protein [Acidobacteriaceae bacterium]|nr:DUF4194 domain-containing protein [Acidobacteriaceae bacterium]